MISLPKLPLRVVAEILGVLLALMALGIQQLRITGVKVEPKLGPIHFVLIDVPGWRQRALDAERQRDDLKTQIKTAQPKAAAAQAAVLQAPAARSAAIAKASAHDDQAYYTKGRAVGDAYAVAHPARLLQPTAPADSPRNADLPATDHAPSLDDRPGGSSAWVAVPRAAYDRLIAYALRLAKVHQDAWSLIGTDAAVADTSEPDTSEAASAAR